MSVFGGRSVGRCIGILSVSPVLAVGVSFRDRWDRLSVADLAYADETVLVGIGLLSSIYWSFAPSKFLKLPLHDAARAFRGSLKLK